MKKKAHPIVVLLLLALLGLAVVWMGGITGKLQEAIKSVDWFPKLG